MRRLNPFRNDIDPAVQQSCVHTANLQPPLPSSSIETLESPRHEGRHLGGGGEDRGGEEEVAGGDNRKEASNPV